MNVFKSSLSLVFYQKTWIIALFAMILVPLVFPHMTPHEFNLGLLEPARAQAAWGVTIFLAIFWALYISAQLGEYVRKTRLTDYFYSMGVSKLSLLAQLFLVSVVCIVPLVAVATVICIVFCSPGHSSEAGMWREMVFQFASLLLLIFLPLSLLAISLASRFSALISYVLTVGVAVYGFYGVGYLEQFLNKQPMPILDAIWHISPHYHVGDLTTRFVFKMGALTESGYLHALCYLLAVGFIFIGLGMMLFRGKPSQKSKGRSMRSAVTCVLLLSLGFSGLSFAKVERRFEPNPLGLFGSEYGRVVALGMQSPIELFWHEGGDHSHEDEETSSDEPHVHLVEKERELPNNLKGFITQMDENKRKRTNPYSSAAQVRVYARGLTERKIRLAWKMDPTQYDNYSNYHFFLTVSGVTERERNFNQAITVARKTLEASRRRAYDPKAMLTAAAAAQNIIDTIVTFQEEKKPYTHYEPWFDLASDFLAHSKTLNDAIHQQQVDVPEGYTTFFEQKYKLLNAIQKGLILKVKRIEEQI